MAMSHANCDHPRTPKARATCRRLNASQHDATPRASRHPAPTVKRRQRAPESPFRHTLDVIRRHIEQQGSLIVLMRLRSWNALELVEITYAYAEGMFDFKRDDGEEGTFGPDDLAELRLL